MAQSWALYHYGEGSDPSPQPGLLPFVWYLTMNLRQKTLLLTTLPLLGLVILLYGSLATILQRSYLQLEHQDAQRNLQRVEEVLTGDLQQMQSLTQDWAAWNDSFAFIEDKNPALSSLICMKAPLKAWA
ncbi:MAG: hypothetical protein HC929_02910 [Leptolyngbyaceae cyanobacterium SM2_5_2]|nr:hypothetical protein [Leptolyngbyaceae cyanobacterium SM2_5_2]